MAKVDPISSAGDEDIGYITASQTGDQMHSLHLTRVNIPVYILHG